MANPTPGWDRVPVYGWYPPSGDGTTQGTDTFLISERVNMVNGTAIYPQGTKITVTIGDSAGQDAAVRSLIRQKMRDAYQAANIMPNQAGAFNGTAWDVWWDARVPYGVFTSFYASDDPNIVQQGYQVKVTENLFASNGQEYYIQPLLAHLDLPVPGINLGDVIVPPGSPTAPAPVYAKGIAGGVAALDLAGKVVNADGSIAGGLDSTALGAYLTTGGYATTTDVSTAVAGRVPTTRTVAGKALSANVTLAASDVGAVPTTRTVAGKALTADVTLTAADVSAVPTTRTVAGKALTADVTLAATDVGASTVGAQVFTAASQLAARTAIAAGTSSLALGTTSSTAKAGDWTPDYTAVPSGSTFTIIKTSGGIWPGGTASTWPRPTSRTDVTFQLLGADPSPPAVVSGTGGMIQGVDIRLRTS